MSAEVVAQRYAKSLIELASENKSLDAVQAEFSALQQVLKQREMELLINSPIVSAGKKKAVFDRVFAEAQPLTKSFLHILLRKGREAYLPAIARSFQQQYRNLKGITPVKLITATKADDQMRDDIGRKLKEKQLVGSQIDWTLEEDPSLIGGFIVEIADKRYDASLASKLQNMKDRYQS